MTEETAGTPRTDEMEFGTEVLDSETVVRVVASEFARQLESEVAALTTQRDEAWQLGLDQIKASDAYKEILIAEKSEAYRRAETAEAQLDELQRGHKGKVIPRDMNGEEYCPDCNQVICTTKHICPADLTTLPTNGTEGLRAELDAAKRALAEEQAKNESLRDALVYSGFMQHGTQQYMLPVGIGLLNNDWVVVTFPDKSKVDTGPRPRAFEMMRAALAAKSTEQGGS